MNLKYLRGNVLSAPMAIIALVILVGIGIYLALYIKNANQELADIEASVLSGEDQARLDQGLTDNPIDDQTSDWQTYTNSQYGFSFQYPKEFGLIKEVKADSTAENPGSDPNDLKNLSISYSFPNSKIIAGVTGSSFTAGRGAGPSEVRYFSYENGQCTYQIGINSESKNTVACDKVSNDNNLDTYLAKEPINFYDQNTILHGYADLSGDFDVLTFSLLEDTSTKAQDNLKNLLKTVKEL